MQNRVTKTQAIKTFLVNSTHPDLAALYHHDQEVQVNVAAGNGTRIEGEYLGKSWHGWNLKTSATHCARRKPTSLRRRGN